MQSHHKFILKLVLISAPVVAGCGLGAGLSSPGNLSGLVPSGARLTSENDFFLDNLELANTNNPYKLVASSPVVSKEQRPVSLYGIFEFKEP